MQTCKHVNMKFIRLQRYRDQREQRGLDVLETRPGSQRLPYCSTMPKIKNILKIQTYLHVLHQNAPAPPLWEARVLTNHPASIERLHFHQMQCKRVERSSELMDDLIAEGLALSIQMVISSLSVRPLNLEADKISYWLIPPYSRNSHSDYTNLACTSLGPLRVK